MKIPLNRGGNKYFTVKTVNLVDYRGNELGEICQAPTVLVPEVIINSNKYGSKNLREIPIRDVCNIIKKAGVNFNGKIDNVSFDESIRNVTLLTGMPITDTTNAYNMLGYGMRNIEQIIAAQIPDEDISRLDDLISNKLPEKNYLYTPLGNNLSLVAPGNHPTVHLLGLIEPLAMRFPVIAKPSNSEPFTLDRIICSLYESGFPAKSMYYLPGDHEIGNSILEESDLGIVFGGQNIKERYEKNGNIKVYGPGNSKIFIDDGYLEDSKTLESVVRSVIGDGGRGCINTKEILVNGNARKFAENVAEILTKIEPIDPQEKDAQIPAVTKENGRLFDNFIETNLNREAEDLTFNIRHSSRLVESDKISYLMPTVIFLEGNNSLEHPLFTELPFQYCSISKFYSEENFKNTLTLAMFTDNEGLIKNTIQKSRINSIQKIYDKLATIDMDLTAPHEGNIFDFLYGKTTYLCSYKVRTRRSNIKEVSSIPIPDQRGVKILA